MAPRDRDEPWNVVDRKGNPVCIPGIDDWLSRSCTDKKPDHSMQYWCRKHLDTCKCGQKRPHKPFRFHQSKVGKATAAANAAGTAPKAAAAAAGGGGAVADTKQVRDMRREIAAEKKNS